MKPIAQAASTQACDFIRAAAGFNPQGAILSRADAYQIRKAIAKAIGMDDAELSKKLAQAEQDKTDEDRAKELRALTAAISFDKDF